MFGSSLVFWFLSPFLYVINTILTILSRHSKTVSNIIIKARLIQDVIRQSPPPSYQSATKTDQTLLRVRALEGTLQKRESELSAKSLSLDRREKQLDVSEENLNKRTD